MGDSRATVKGEVSRGYMFYNGMVYSPSFADEGTISVPGTLFWFSWKATTAFDMCTALRRHEGECLCTALRYTHCTLCGCECE